MLERMTGHATESLGESLRVTVLAAGRDLRAPPHGVPGRVGPFDRAAIRHSCSCVQYQSTARMTRANRNITGHVRSHSPRSVFNVSGSRRRQVTCSTEQPVANSFGQVAGSIPANRHDPLALARVAAVLLEAGLYEWKVKQARAVVNGPRCSAEVPRALAVCSRRATRAHMETAGRHVDRWRGVARARGLARNEEKRARSVSYLPETAVA
jgi:hypothetical protein